MIATLPIFVGVCLILVALGKRSVVWDFITLKAARDRWNSNPQTTQPTASQPSVAFPATISPKIKDAATTHREVWKELNRTRNAKFPKKFSATENSMAQSLN
jgi:hypothetical protein